ncbi:hypothetical protein EYF80_025574 [Liparis tanakae]|uniref:Uncharacterized protein n=1 Tax=Liparis tanakae TaxID=230148 RepID=A0A4Z2HES0_9TELE|nr:hypothetical protein EYF80_025574 [Liparis tanakae]
MTSAGPTHRSRRIDEKKSANEQEVGPSDAAPSFPLHPERDVSAVITATGFLGWRRDRRSKREPPDRLARNTINCLRQR